MKTLSYTVILFAALACWPHRLQAAQINFQSDDAKSDLPAIFVHLVNRTVDTVKFAVSDQKKAWNAYQLKSGKGGSVWPDEGDSKTIFIKFITDKKELIRPMSLGQRYEIFFDDKENARWDVQKVKPRK